jgi:predicted nucleic acid-binding protein
VQRGEASVVVSTVTEAELRVLPEKQRDSAALERIDDFLSEDGMVVIGVDRRIARRAAAVRATTPGIRLPDAIIIATALETGCEAVVGNDHAWAKARGLPFVQLDGLE